MTQRLRQGQSYWSAILYTPGQLQGYDDQAVAIVERVFITKTRGTTVYYTHGTGHHYLCGSGYFKKHFHPTYRKAIARGHVLINDFVDAVSIQAFDHTHPKEHKQGHKVYSVEYHLAPTLIQSGS